MDLEYLESVEFLEKAMPAFAKHFGGTAEMAWQLLQEDSNSLKAWLADLKDSAVRHQVNLWWRQHRSCLAAWHLGRLAQNSLPAKLPDAVYAQIVCLTWLTQQFLSPEPAEIEGEPRQLPMVQPVSVGPLPVLVPKISWWQRLWPSLKNFFIRGGNNNGRHE